MKEISIIAAVAVQGQTTRAAVETGSVRERNQAIRARLLLHLLLLGRETTDTRGTMGKAAAVVVVAVAVVVVADLRLPLHFPLLVPNAAANHIRAESDSLLHTQCASSLKVCT